LTSFFFGPVSLSRAVVFFLLRINVVDCGFNRQRVMVRA
jgi:hypothetical protein